MTVIVFLVDTSASMNQKTYLGLSTLDVIKTSIATTFLQTRMKDVSSRGDRYMLLTFDQASNGDRSYIKSGWKESTALLLDELKHLKATGYSDTGAALKNVFDMLNLNRAQSGIETYGRGRCPFYLEPTYILCFTDGQMMTNSTGILRELQVPMTAVVPGAELTIEPFRWDQQIFGIYTQFPIVGKPIVGDLENLPIVQDNALGWISSNSGGQSFMCNTKEALDVAITKCIMEFTCSGVMCHFVHRPLQLASSDVELLREEQVIGLKDDSWKDCRVKIAAIRGVENRDDIHWPVPEEYWPDIVTLNNPPPRSAHPTLHFSEKPTSLHWPALAKFPIDRYEIRPCPLVDYFRSSQLQSGELKVWLVSVPGSGKHAQGLKPFGYVTVDAVTKNVVLHILPYNFPTSLMLLSEVVDQGGSKKPPSKQWAAKFDDYLRSTPPYYISLLRNSLRNIGVSTNIISQELIEPMTQCLSIVDNMTKKYKNVARLEMERLVNDVSFKAKQIQQRRAAESGSLYTFAPPLICINYELPVPPPAGQRISANAQPGLVYLDDVGVRQELLALPAPVSQIGHETLRVCPAVDHNQWLYNVTRDGLRASLTELVTTKRLPQTELPVSRMGDYQRRLETAPRPLRPVEERPTRAHIFGNPFVNSKQPIIDETIEANVGGTAKAGRKHHHHVRSRPSHSIQPPKAFGRGKRGPLPLDFKYTQCKKRRLLLAGSQTPDPYSSTVQSNSSSPRQNVQSSSCPSTPLRIELDSESIGDQSWIDATTTTTTMLPNSITPQGGYLSGEFSAISGQHSVLMKQLIALLRLPARTAILPRRVDKIFPQSSIGSLNTTRMRDDSFSSPPMSPSSPRSSARPMTSPRLSARSDSIRSDEYDENYHLDDGNSSVQYEIPLLSILEKARQLHPLSHALAVQKAWTVAVSFNHLVVLSVLSRYVTEYAEAQNDKVDVDCNGDERSMQRHEWSQLPVGEVMQRHREKLWQLSSARKTLPL